MSRTESQDIGTGAEALCKSCKKKQATKRETQPVTRVCARPGCGKEFVPSGSQWRRQKYHDPKCRAAVSRAKFKAAHPETEEMAAKRRAASNKWHKANREYRREYKRVRRRQNKDKVNAYKRELRAKDLPAARAKARDYRARNLDRCRAMAKAAYIRKRANGMLIPQPEKAITAQRLRELLAAEAALKEIKKNPLLLLGVKK